MSKYSGFDLDVRNLKINVTKLNVTEVGSTGCILDTPIGCPAYTDYCQTLDLTCDNCSGTVSNLNVIGKTAPQVVVRC